MNRLSPRRTGAGLRAATLVAALLVGPSALAAPQYFATTLTNSGTTQIPGPETGSTYNQPTGPATASSTSTQSETTTAGSATGWSTASATAQAGTVGTASFGRGTTTGGVGAQGAASGRSVWDETFVLQAAGFNGQSATMDFLVDIDGMLDPIVTGIGWGGISWWRATLMIGNESWVFSNQLNGDGVNGLLYWSNPLDSIGTLGLKGVTASLLVGEEYRVRMELETSARATASQSFGATDSQFRSDLTFSCRGIDSLLIGGSPQSAFSAITTTGFDLATCGRASGTVPEPDMLSVLGLGLAFLGTMRRRATRRPVMALGDEAN